MPILLTRVVNEQTIVGSASILLDKIDKSQGNSDSPPYAQRAKQKIYVPYVNPVDPTVKGYVDMVQSDEVLLAMEPHGTIGGLESDGIVTVTVFSSVLIATPTVTSAANALGDTTINGTTYLSLSPDITYVDFTNLTGVTQRVAQAVFTTHTAVQIVVPDTEITIGAPGVGWTVQILSNSKSSAIFTL
jgi:hypothetical protein